jgi:hypothetical protein
LPVLIVLQPVAIRGIEKPGFFVYSEENETLTELALIRKEERLNPQMLIGSVQAPLAIGYAIYASNLTIEQSYKELAEAVHRMNHLLEIHGGLMYRMSLRKPGNKVHYVKVDDVYLAPFYFIKEIEDLNGGLHNEKIE